jgi:hypothetical protein
LIALPGIRNSRTFFHHRDGQRKCVVVLMSEAEHYDSRSDPDLILSISWKGCNHPSISGARPWACRCLGEPGPPPKGWFRCDFRTALLRARARDRPEAADFTVRPSSPFDSQGVPRTEPFLSGIVASQQNPGTSICRRREAWQRRAVRATRRHDDPSRVRR